MLSFLLFLTLQLPLILAKDDPKLTATSSIFFFIIFLTIIGTIVFFIVTLIIKVKADSIKSYSSFFEQLSYQLDYYFSMSKLSKPILLLVLTLLLVCCGGILHFISSGDLDDMVDVEDGFNRFVGSIWWAWLLLSDSGSQGDPDENLGARLIDFVFTVFGLVIFGFLIGIVSEIVGEQVDKIKKGKSRVCVGNHHLLLGWSSALGPVITELAIANESESNCTIVILADRDKEQMEKDIQDSELDLKGTKIVCRSGEPTNIADLHRASSHSAKSIIIFTDANSRIQGNDADAESLRIMLSVLDAGCVGHIVVEVRNIHNVEIFKLLGAKKVECVVATDMIGRIVVQCMRQPGLALALDSLLGFEGSEFYAKKWKDSIGKSFGEILYSFPKAVPVGIFKTVPSKKPGFPPDQTVLINPKNDYIIGQSDQILVIAEDDNSYSIEKAKIATASEERRGKDTEQLPEKVLFVGWRCNMKVMLQQLDGFCAPGSDVTTFCEKPIEEREKTLGDFKPTNYTLNHIIGNPVTRKQLESLPIEEFDSIMIVADDALEDFKKMDSRSLSSLALVRHIHATRTWGSSFCYENSFKETYKKLHAMQKQIELQWDELQTVKRDLTRQETRKTAIRDLTNLEQKLVPRQSIDIKSTPTPKSPRRSARSKSPRRKTKQKQQDPINDEVGSQIKNVENAIISKRPKKACTIISEIRDPHAKDLISTGHSADYVASDQLVSKALSQIAEWQAIASLWDELLSSDGNEIYAESACAVLEDGEELSFWDVTARCRKWLNSIPLGYLDDSRDTDHPKLYINPDYKDKKRVWSRRDKIMMIKE